MKYMFAILFLFFCFPEHSFSQNQLRYAITNVEQSGEIISITYYHTPIGDKPDDEYDVSVRITRETDKTFGITMKEAGGDIGDGTFVGNNRRINWAFKKQFPKGLPFDDLEFELTITKNKGIPSWVWYSGGAAVVGAGAVILLSKKKEDAAVDGTTTLPIPPSGRPN